MLSMEVDVREGDYQAGVEKIIRLIKNRIENNDKTSSMGMEFFMFLSSFGYKKGSQKLFNTIETYLAKYNLEVSIN